MTEFLDQRHDPYPTRVADRSESRLIPREDPVVWGKAEDGPMDHDDLKGYGEHGYLTIDQLVTRDELEELRGELRRLSQDPEVRADERTVVEAASEEVRSVFEVHRTSDVFARFIHDSRIADRARQILGSDVYVHQSRVNFKPGFGGREFYWHSDFETWHAEDGMPRMRAVSLSLSLTDNHRWNGPLMIMPGSHRTYVSCGGETPDDNYQSSLVAQEAGTPDEAALNELYAEHGIDVLEGPAGGAIMFDSNCMHGSNGNITPDPRSNLFVVFNSVDNALVEPFGASRPRPEFLGAREFTPVV